MTRVSSFFGLALLIALPHPARAQGTCDSEIPFGDNDAAGRFVQVDSSRVYYETYGDAGSPTLVLVHGNGGSISSMRCQIIHFMQDYHVVVADNRTHGKSGGSEDLTYDQIASDYVAILNDMGLDSVFVLGQSDGGIIGLLLAIDYPEKVSKVVAAVPNLWPGKSAIAGWELEFSKGYRAHIDSMIATGDTSRDWENERLHMNLMVNEPHILLTDLEAITSPVLVMTSDDDIIRPRHILEIYEHIPNAHLFVMPGATHFMLRDEYELFNYMADRFLKAPFERPTSRQVLMELLGVE